MTLPKRQHRYGSSEVALADFLVASQVIGDGEDNIGCLLRTSYKLWVWGVLDGVPVDLRNSRRIASTLPGPLLYFGPWVNDSSAAQRFSRVGSTILKHLPPNVVRHKQLAVADEDHHTPRSLMHGGARIWLTPKTPLLCSSNSSTT